MRGNDEDVGLAHSKSRLLHLKRSMPGRGRELAKKETALVRIIKAVFGNGEWAAFMVNLREGSAREIKRLYRKRRPIE
jgi:hypothetical protein